MQKMCEGFVVSHLPLSRSVTNERMVFTQEEPKDRYELGYYG